MPFQFYCPQGHLLEGHESQMGTPGQCPMCGAMFVFPQMAGAAPPGPQYGGTQPQGPFSAHADGGGMYAQSPGHYAEPPPPPPEPTIYRILCPKGHELQTPAEMLGTKAQCPYCNAVLELTYENSVEHRDELQRQQRINEQRQQMREEARGRFWLNIAIVVVVLAVGGLIGAFVYFNR
jgi:hypothetical protein